MNENDPILQAIGFLREDIHELDKKSDARHHENERRLDEGSLLMGELSFGLRELNDREKERNGKLDRHDQWIEAQKRAHLLAEGAKAQRADDIARVKSLKEYWPLIAGVVLFLSSVASFVLGGLPWR